MPKIVTLWMFHPTHAEILGVSVILTPAALCINGRPIWQSILLAAICFSGVTHIVLGAPISTLKAVMANPVLVDLRNIYPETSGLRFRLRKHRPAALGPRTKDGGEPVSHGGERLGESGCSPRRSGEKQRGIARRRW
jgi:hypothetical protein